MSNTRSAIRSAIASALTSALAACEAASLPHAELAGLDASALLDPSRDVVALGDALMAAAIEVSTRAIPAIRRTNEQADEDQSPRDKATVSAQLALTCLIRALITMGVADARGQAALAAGAAADARSAVEGLSPAAAEDRREAASLAVRQALSPWAVDDRVRGDQAGVADEDIEDGSVLEVRGGRVRVAWDSGVRTWCDAEELSEAR